MSKENGQANRKTDMAMHILRTGSGWYLFWAASVARLPPHSGGPLQSSSRFGTEPSRCIERFMRTNDGLAVALRSTISGRGCGICKLPHHDSHQFCHIRRNAPSTSAAYWPPSISGDDCIRAAVRSKCGKPVEIAGPLEGEFTYCSGVSAISSGRPTFERILAPAAAHRRAAGQRDDRNAHPESVQRADVAVVGEGIEAQVEIVIAMEIRQVAGTRATNSTRSAAMPPSWNSSARPSR